MTAGNHSRREFVCQLLCLIAGSSFLGCENTSQPGLQSTQDIMWLKENIPFLESAARLGDTYLSAYPAEKDSSWLSSQIEKALRIQITSDYKAIYSVQNISDTIQADYMRNETVLVGKWIVSRTEARIYALVSHHAQELGYRK